MFYCFSWNRCFSSIQQSVRKLKYFQGKFIRILVFYHSCFRRNGLRYWIFNAIGFLVFFFFLMITWFKKLWILLRPINEDDPNLVVLPSNKILRYLFSTSKSIMSNVLARMLIYIVSICVLTLSALIHLVF